MLLWHLDDPVENAALQFVSAIFTVPQISMKIEELPKDHITMLTHYLSFWKQWREVLIDGKLTADNPEMNYTVAASTLGNKSVIVPYCNVITQVKTDTAVILNATGFDFVSVQGAKNKIYKVVSCMGETLSEGKIEADIQQINAPLSAQIFIS